MSFKREVIANNLIFGAEKREVDLLEYDERITFLP